MTVAMYDLLERLEDIRFDLHYRQYPLDNKLSRAEEYGDRPIQALKRFNLELRAILEEMETKATYVAEPHLFARTQLLLKELTEIIEPYSVNYVVFEELVKSMPYRRLKGEMPDEILVNLSNHTYNVAQAVSALNNYLELCEGHFGPFPNADEIRDELTVIELMESMR